MLCVEEYNERLRFEYLIEQRKLVTQAYLTAAWQRANKMPPLRRVLADLEPKEKPRLEPMTDTQMLAAALRWQKQFERGEEGK